MAYSFISPKPKAIFRRETKIWFAYTMLAFMCIIAFERVVEYQTSQKMAEYMKTQDEIQEIKLKSIVVRDYIERLHYEIKLGEGIETYNKGLQDALINLLKLVPDQITTRGMELEYDSLTLKGMTPSRDAYKFLLEAPLRAIFTRTRVEFYPLASGWFNFVSVSKTIRPPSPKSESPESEEK